MVRNMILLVHDRCIWPRTHSGCSLTHTNVSRVLGKALKIFATIVTQKTIVHCVRTFYNVHGKSGMLKGFPKTYHT